MSARVKREDWPANRLEAMVHDGKRHLRDPKTICEDEKVWDALLQLARRLGVRKSVGKSGESKPSVRALLWAIQDGKVALVRVDDPQGQAVSVKDREAPVEDVRCPGGWEE